MACAFTISEQLAQAAHIEYLRVDVFLDRGNPSGCMINEISLTSGYPYYGHGEYIAKLWSENMGKSKVMESTQPVYKLEPAAKEEPKPSGF